MGGRRDGMDTGPRPDEGRAAAERRRASRRCPGPSRRRVPDGRGARAPVGRMRRGAGGLPAGSSSVFAPVLVTRRGAGDPARPAGPRRRPSDRAPTHAARLRPPGGSRPAPPAAPRAGRRVRPSCPAESGRPRSPRPCRSRAPPARPHPRRFRPPHRRTRLVSGGQRAAGRRRRRLGRIRAGSGLRTDARGSPPAASGQHAGGPPVPGAGSGRAVRRSPGGPVHPGRAGPAHRRPGRTRAGSGLPAPRATVPPPAWARMGP